MTVLSQKIVVTRKPHSCWGCGRVYPTGTRMNVVVNVDHKLLRSYWCGSCGDVLSLLPSYESDDGWDFGDVRAGYPDEWEHARQLRADK